MKRLLMRYKFLLLVCVVILSVSASVFAQFGLDKLIKKPTNINPSDIVNTTQGVSKMVKGATGIGIKEEMSIGGSVSLEIIANYGGLLKDAGITKRVNLIGKSLGMYSDRPGLNYRFGVLNSPSINAFSAPGGYVFITKGAYDAAANDDQLAGILAHEICHISARHALRMISRNEFISGMAQTARGASSDFARYDLGVSNISRTLFKAGYDSGSEFDADQNAAQLAFATGYNRNGLKQFLAGLQAQGRKKSIISTHPDLHARVKRL